jgi:hypothetical protein
VTKIFTAAAVAALALGAAAPASAYTVLFEGGQPSPDVAKGFRVVADFNDGSYSGFQVNNTSQVQVLRGNSASGAQPANALPSNTSYLSVLTGGSATYTFAGNGVTAFQFDWGSIDSYNTLSVHMAGQPSAIVIPGSALFANPANGNQTQANTNGRFSLLGTSGERFTGITLTSSGNSFEIDNLATGAVPEPATWGLMLMGFGMVGAGLRTRRRAVAFA